MVIPTYNERENVDELVRRINDALSGEHYDVVFVDDDSPDGTARQIDLLSATFPVSVVVRKDRRGLASAVVEGFTHSTGDIIGVMDADLQHPPEAMVRLLKEIRRGADVAVASRYEEGGRAPGLSPARAFLSRCAVAAAHIILPATMTVTDPMSGCFAFRRSVITGKQLKPIGFKVLLEILAIGRHDQIAQVPITLDRRGSGVTKMGLREQLEYLAHLLSLMSRTGELRRFVKFCLVGASGVGVNLGLLWLLTEQVGLFYLLSACISIEASIISNYVLNHLFTFRDRQTRGARSFLRKLRRFNIVSLVGVGINLGTLWLLTSLVGVYYLISSLVGIALATLWNFLVNNRWTWGSGSPSTMWAKWSGSLCRTFRCRTSAARKRRPCRGRPMFTSRGSDRET